MRNPFFPRYLRERKYFFWITLFIAIHLGISSYQVDRNTSGLTLMSFKKGNWFLPYHRHLIEAIFLATICFAVRILFRLRYQGKESTLKRKILCRHILYLSLIFIEFVYTLTEMYNDEVRDLIKAKFPVPDRELQNHLDQWYFNSTVAFLLPVLPILVLRACEPYVFQEIKVQVKRLKCSKR